MEDKRELPEIVLCCCVTQLCTVVRTHIWTVLTGECWFRFRFSFCAFV